MLCIGATEFIISCVKTRVSRLHDSTSLRASSRFISLPISFSVFCRSRSPGNSRVVGRRKVKSWLRSASRIRRARRDRRRWWRMKRMIRMTRRRRSPIPNPSPIGRGVMCDDRGSIFNWWCNIDLFLDKNVCQTLAISGFSLTSYTASAS